jgi:hypothetical protein
MSSLPKTALVSWLIALGTLVCSAADPAKAENGTVVFSGVQYLHRWAQGEQHEFTPTGQEDLKSWSDMVTVVCHRSVKDGDGLAAIANSALENYKAHGAKVVRTDSVPRTPTKPAEYLMVVLFPRPEFIEAAFARFKLVEGIGLSVVYSHRQYGKKIGHEMSAWLQANGAATEKALMAMENIPLLDAAGK